MQVKQGHKARNSKGTRHSPCVHTYVHVCLPAWLCMHMHVHVRACVCVCVCVCATHVAHACGWGKLQAGSVGSNQEPLMVQLADAEGWTHREGGAVPDE